MRFAQLLTLLFGWGLMAGPALAAPALSAPRVAAYDGYTRLVLDLPTGVKYRLEPLGAVLRVTLVGIVGTPATVSVKKPELSGFTIANAASNTVLNIVAPQGVAPQSGFKASILEPATGKAGYRLVLDFSGAFADTTKLVDPPALHLTFTPAQPLTVLLDPGHGGSDPGALGNGLREDTLNLSMAMRVKMWLERVPGVRVELTRVSNTVFSSDKRTDLNARARMSRGKTLFVSLHANAVPRASHNSQFGAETYYFSPLPTKPFYVAPLAPRILAGPAFTPSGVGMSGADATPTSVIYSLVPSAEPPPADLAPALTPDDPQPAALEPDGALPEDTAPVALETPVEDPNLTAPLEEPAPITPASPAPVVAPSSPALALATTPLPIGVSLTLPSLERVSASKLLASSVQSRLIYATQAKNRGVRSADFYVIKNAECPAILVEIGFLTHPIEAQMLKNANYLERVSYGVASGVTAYLSDLVAP